MASKGKGKGKRGRQVAVEAMRDSILQPLRYYAVERMGSLKTMHGPYDTWEAARAEVTRLERQGKGE